MIIDLVSTGRTWSLLDIARDVHVMIESDDYAYSSEVVRPKWFSSEFRTSEIGRTSFVWEVLNCADHGMALGLGDPKANWLRFAPNELPHDFVRSMHGVVDSLLQSLKGLNVDDLLANPQEVFLLAHSHLLDIIDSNSQIFDQIRHAENVNIGRLGG